MVEIASRTHAQVAEGPTWLPETGELLWVDIPAAEIHYFSPSTAPAGPVVSSARASR
ncbi:SMP-30/gluconolactonase/LRE family protein [Microtetraspora sp. NBRC 16547]|uniref:SMP-30/gluconolactonase/LRE family protein n=1 Tax=Microtetraspora sp. NBRC 16547 TaxID=3030993 RepID=UPI00331C4CB9